MPCICELIMVIMKLDTASHCKIYLNRNCIALGLLRPLASVH